jgi:cytidylate kinase
MSENAINLDNFEENKDQLKERFKVSFDPGTPGEPVRVLFENNDITSTVRTEEMAKLTSNLAAEPIIREFIKPAQREFMKAPGLIADGRDMGTVIFSDAKYKIFLTASVEERAKRRQTQLKRQGLEVNMRSLLQELEERDRKDTEREHSPLVPAKDSVIIDTSNLNPEGVVKEIKTYL